MINDLLNGHQWIVCVHHCMVQWVERLTIDNQRLSMAVDLVSEISVSAILDDRKRFVFRPFEQISARFGGNVSALQATQSSPALPLS
ncbi:hypothetical protein, partial [Rhizobium leguminosarum]